jgi:hypothetical protein
VDKSVDMGIKDKSLTKNKSKGLPYTKSVYEANNLDLLKTDSLFSVHLLNF